MKKFAALALASIVMTSNLQAQPTNQGQQRQAQPQAMGPNLFVAFAVRAVNNLDQGRAAFVYDRASSAFKASTTKDRFVSDVTRKRQQVGKIVNRQWSSVSRSTITVNGRQQPLVVVTLIATTDKRQTYNEIVQFTLEPNNGWRIANYTF